jgi:hypothetical protein
LWSFVLFFSFKLFLLSAKANHGAAALILFTAVLFFGIYIDYRGHHRKGVAIYNAA